MQNTDPILVVTADQDDFEILERAFELENIPNKLVWLRDGDQGMNYLKNNPKPFLVLSDVYMPAMSGLEFRKAVEADPVLRSKSVPFIFLSESLYPTEVDAVYSMAVQGLFDKRSSLNGLRTMVSVICQYWQLCRHPMEKPKLSNES